MYISISASMYACLYSTSAQHTHPICLLTRLLEEGVGEVVGDLPAHRDDDANGLLPLVDVQHTLQGQLLEEEPVRFVVVRRDLSKGVGWLGWEGLVFVWYLGGAYPHLGREIYRPTDRPTDRIMPHAHTHTYL